MPFYKLCSESSSLLQAASLQAPNQDALLFKDLHESWETKHNCKVTTGTRETFMDLFDDDDTLEYEPATTAALIFTGGDEEAEKEALEVICASVEFLHRGKPCSVQRIMLIVCIAAHLSFIAFPKCGLKIDVTCCCHRCARKRKSQCFRRTVRSRSPQST